MLDGQHPRAQCPPNACSEFGKTIRPLSVVGNNLDRLDRRRPVDPWIVIGVRIVMTNDVGDANHDIDATYHISRRNPSGCGRFRPAALARQDLIGLVSLDSGFRLVLRSTASRELPAEQPTSGGEVAARVQGVGRPCTAGKVHRGAVCLGLRFPAWRSQSTPTTGMLLSAQNRASFGDAERTHVALSRKNRRSPFTWIPATAPVISPFSVRSTRRSRP